MAPPGQFPDLLETDPFLSSLLCPSAVDSAVDLDFGEEIYPTDGGDMAWALNANKYDTTEGTILSETPSIEPIGSGAKRRTESDNNCTCLISSISFLERLASRSPSRENRIDLILADVRDSINTLALLMACARCAARAELNMLLAMAARQISITCGKLATCCEDIHLRGLVANTNDSNSSHQQKDEHDAYSTNGPVDISVLTYRLDQREGLHLLRSLATFQITEFQQHIKTMKSRYRLWPLQREAGALIEAENHLSRSSHPPKSLLPKESILLLEKGLLVPTYGVERVNPKLKLSDWHLVLPQDVIMWPTQGLRRISINSFGFGGANAHVILDDAYHYLQDRGLTGKHNVDIIHRLFLFSGKDQTGAKRVFEGFATWLQGGDSDDKHDTAGLDDLAYTLALRRSHMEHRTFALASSIPELSKRLTKGFPAATRSQRHGDNLVMVFTGQGAQWPAMGRELFQHPIFRQSIDASQHYLEAFGYKWNALEELSKTPNPNVDLAEYSQPLCTVIQVALVDLVRFWGITPAATVGHSSGEIAAAYAASLLTHRDAIKLAYVRGISSAAVPKQGAMMAAGISRHDAQIYLEKVAPGSAVVSCVNSPSSVTLSGDVDAIDDLETMISADGRFARKLKVTTAYHSPHMRHIAANYLAMIGEMTPKQPNGTSDSDSDSDSDNRPAMYSSLTGSMVTSAEQLNAEYWVANMENPVLFSQALLALLKHKKVAPGGNGNTNGNTRPVAVQWGGFLEIGPHAALQGPLRQIIDVANNKFAKFAKFAPYASMLIRGRDATETSLSAAGTLWAAGTKMDLAAVNNLHRHPDTSQMLCDLPTYPWNHSRSFWHESYSSHAYRFPAEARNDFLGIAEDARSTRHEPRWRNYLRVAENPWIEDHVITGTVLYPGAGMFVMALEGVLRTADPSKTVEGFRMTDVTFERGLVISLDDEAPVETRISLHPLHRHSGPSGWLNGPSEVEEGNVDALWRRHVSLRETLLSEPRSSAVDVDEFYSHLETIGMQYGPSFRNVVALTAVPSKDASYGTVAVPDTKSIMPSHHESLHIIHPATLDSIFHLVIASLDAGRPEKSAVPYAIEELYIARHQPQGSGALYSGHGRLLSKSDHEMTTELFVSDQDWAKPKLTIKNFALRQVTSGVGLETAVDSSSSRAAVRKCAGITWIPDLSFVTSNEHLVELASSSDKKTAPLVNAFLDSVFLKITERTYMPTKIIALAASEPRLQLMRAALGEGAENTTIIYRRMPEDGLLETLAPNAFDLVLGLGVPDVADNAAVLAKLAPLVWLTQAGQLDKGSVSLGSCVAHVAQEKTYVSYLANNVSLSTLPELPESVVLLLPESPSGSLKTFANKIKKKLTGFGVSVGRTNLTLQGTACLDGKSVISLLEIDSPLVYAWDEEQFNAFKKLVSTVGHLL
ncbi:t1pks [Epichloe bromicola]|uniref:T1pks n=1 Tax=Epichloe bromicola TaxID=79588 RepID=A0ABQ0CV03_9HYPO